MHLGLKTKIRAENPLEAQVTPACRVPLTPVITIMVDFCVILDCRISAFPAQLPQFLLWEQVEMLGMASSINYNAIATAVTDMTYIIFLSELSNISRWRANTLQSVSATGGQILECYSRNKHLLFIREAQGISTQE